MAEPQGLQLQSMILEGKQASPIENTNQVNQPTNPLTKNFKWWLLVILFALFILAGQSSATLLGRLYFDKGGNSTWMSGLVQTCGFPILIPLYFLATRINPNTNSVNSSSPSMLYLASLYGAFGIFLAGLCLLYSVGLLYLPVSTYSLICASQLGFNAFFSFFLNSQKFTPFIINSVFLLTISSCLLVFQGSSSSQSTNVSKTKYAIGFTCTLAGSACYGLSLSLSQFTFRRILKQETFKVVLDMIFFPSLVASSALLVGLFASGQWQSLSREMEVFRLGKVSYIMTLMWIAISWQLFSIGSIGLIYQVSALFSNVISTLGLPVVPVLAAIFFHEKMGGIKVIALILALWGFVSYMYQHYLEDCNSKADPKHDEKGGAFQNSPTEKSTTFLTHDQGPAV